MLTNKCTVQFPYFNGVSKTGQRTSIVFQHTWCGFSHWRDYARSRFVRNDCRDRSNRGNHPCLMTSWACKVHAQMICLESWDLVRNRNQGPIRHS